MKPSPQKLPVGLLLFLCGIGGCALIFGFWTLDRGLAAPGAWSMLGSAYGVFFITFVWALTLLMRWRDARRVPQASPTSHPGKGMEGTVYGLSPGAQYEIKHTFIDYYGNVFTQGEILHFNERHFLPYEGGHTLVFRERAMYLQEERNQEILNHFSVYIVEAETKK